MVLGSLAAGEASASGSGTDHSLRASGAASSHGVAVKSHTITAGGKCGTSFGPELPTVDGLIAWNDGASFDTAGGADVVCKGRARKRKIHTVSAYGYFGAATETFHVTFYGNSTTSGSNEPDDSKVLCDYPSLTGSAGGQYPTHALTTLQLGSVCKLPKGISWVAIQNVNPSGPWYWEMQDALGGSTTADWVDRNDAFGSGCTTFDNDRYLVDCLGYPYPDFMLLLK
jgi:hypothetical protein